MNNKTELQERIARILNDEGWTFEGVHEPGEYDECEDCRRVVDPIAARIAEEITAEVRKAKAEALREEAVRISLLADEYRLIEFADRDAVFYAGVRVALQREAGSVRSRADQIENRGRRQR